MQDKHGKEIQVGNTVRFHFYDGIHKYGTVSNVSETTYCVLNWDNPGWYECSKYVEIVDSVGRKAPAKSLSELKRQAQQEILELIQKHTSAINSAGGSFGLHVSMYDGQGIISKHPKQLVDVNVTVTI